MIMWEDMMKSDWPVIFYYFSICIFSGFASSFYYQKLIGVRVNYLFTFSSLIGSIIFFMGVFATYWWDFPSAILGGILGGWLFTRKLV
jgi:predicted permease